MSWREALRPASFRGVEFHIASVDGTFGRNTVQHDFPLRDTPYMEDMGRRARVIRIEAFLVGADYHERLQQLIAAVETAGPATLVHPTLGELRVALDGQGFTSHEQLIAQGGMAKVNFSVVEAGEARFPSARTSTPDVVRTSAATAREQLAQGFQQRFEVASLPEFAQDMAGGRVARTLELARTALGAYGDGVTRGNVLGLLERVAPGIAGRLRQPLALALEVVDLVQQLRQAMPAREADTRLGAMAGAVAVGTPWTAVTATRKADNRNRAAWIELVQGAVAIERAEALLDTEFEDDASARAGRDAVVDALDAVMETTGDDALYGALADLRAAVVADVSVRVIDLAHMGRYVPTATLPMLVVAQRLYGNGAREDELLARNAVRHPGFVPAGRALEVVIDG